MCTVTFIAQNDNQFILTSSRDEAPGRETLPPSIYEIDGNQLLFPKDVVAGGTWIGASDRCRLVCLLNGGFELHERKSSYRMSRGMIVRALLLSESLKKTLTSIDLENIEPFTIIAVSWEEKIALYELVWDGEQRHFQKLPLTPRIWSSSTLYDKEAKVSRNDWFKTAQFSEKSTPQALHNFHHTAGAHDLMNSVQMDRGFVKTVSITQVHYQSETLYMHYEDLQNEMKYTEHLEMAIV